jgi:predicted negative regulator of RcsB-dependent stress response
MPQMRLFWRDLNEMRNAWWFLLPLLVWVGWRTYRNERRDLRWQQATSRR